MGAYISLNLKIGGRAYRSMGAKRDKYGIASTSPSIGFTDN